MKTKYTLKKKEEIIEGFLKNINNNKKNNNIRFSFPKLQPSFEPLQLFNESIFEGIRVGV